jgi:DsbC/DsbD-like thiol-disulfide interchange protein
MCIFCIGVPSVQGVGAMAQTLTPTLGHEVATLRLVATPGLAGGTYRAGLEIVMAPGSHTYWRQPGEAGVPPVFAFNGSRNVAKADVLFPTPSRISEDGIDAFGYRDKVLFPVLVTPIDTTKKAVLEVDILYAVCNKICIPAHDHGTLVLPPDGAADDGVAVTAAIAEVPIPLSDNDRAALTIVPTAGAPKPRWTLVWSGPKPVEDIFPVAPDGFYFSSRKIGTHRFELSAEQIGGNQKAGHVAVSLTLKRQDGGSVTTEDLDVTSASR